MKIELKNVKHAAFASTDSECFEASLYIDGKRAGTVSDDGHGGSMMFSDRATQERLDAYGATLPPSPLEGMTEADGSPATIQPDAEILVGDALNAYLLARDLRKQLKSRVVFVKDGGLSAFGPFTPANLAQSLGAGRAALLARIGTNAATVLNLMDEPAALAAYKEFG